LHYKYKTMSKEKQKTKAVTITLMESEKEKARKISKEILGRENLSALFAYWITTYQLKEM